MTASDNEQDDIDIEQDDIHDVTQGIAEDENDGTAEAQPTTTTRRRKMNTTNREMTITRSSERKWQGRKAQWPSDSTKRPLTNYEHSRNHCSIFLAIHFQI